jgi:carbon-monoxide dehydrogenase large subunit
MMPKAGSILGNSVVRLEDPALLTGEARYVDDLPAEGCLHVAFVRSPLAHGRVTGVGATEALSAPGVVAVYCVAGDDLDLAPMKGDPTLPEGLERPPLAMGTVRFVGDIVAAVVAESRAQAVDAAEQVLVDYEPLEPVMDLVRALDDEGPLLFPEHGTNVCAVTELGDRQKDPTAGADVVVEVTMVSQRLAGVPMENNGMLAVPDGEGLQCWISHQAPHFVHDELAAVLGIEPASLRVACPWVGGGFGPKAAMYPEYAITAAAARRLGRPVKWAETRSENMVSMVHGRDMLMTGRLGLRRDGTIVGLDADVLASAGAYPALGAILPVLTQLMAPGVYEVPEVRFRGRSVMTNNTTTGAYRGAGRPEATQLIERLVDKAARKLRMDPAELRRKNFIPSDAFPVTTATGAHYDSGDYERALDVALAKAGYAELRAEQARRRKEEGGILQLGIGVAAYVEVTAPFTLYAEYGALSVNDDGSATVTAGTSAHGQGHHTSFAMVAHDVLGIPMEKIDLVNSDTKTVPRGEGTMGSRSLQTAGAAVHVSAKEVLARARAIAAHLLEASADDLIVGDGGLHVVGSPTTLVPWAELAVASRDKDRLPQGLLPAPLRHELDYDGGGSTYPFGVHVAVVEIDTETGKVTLVRHVAVDDCGRILNPMLVDGQVHGGIAQGAAQALYEWVAYDEIGNPVTSNLADYAIPSAADLPSFEVVSTETPTPRNPLGAKGVGESGTLGSTPAIQGAVIDGLAHLGVEHVEMPCTPERVWRAIRAAEPATVAGAGGLTVRPASAAGSPPDPRG